MTPIIPEWHWEGMQFSIARHTGAIKIYGETYIVVNEKGITIFELSDPKSEHYVGEGNKAIPPRKPCDLVAERWIPIYRKLGRNLTTALVINHYNYERAKAFADNYSEDTEISDELRADMRRVAETQEEWEKLLKKRELDGMQ